MNKKNLLIAGVGALLATAATIFFLKKKKAEGDEKPPKNAPQLDINNPGTQSEFPRAASDSEIG